jgi:hypothetical protein
MFVQGFRFIQVQFLGHLRDIYGRGSIPDRDKAFFSTPQPADRFWGPSPGSKETGYEADHSPTLNLYLHSPIRLHDVMLT